MVETDLSFVIIEYHSLDEIRSAVTSVGSSCSHVPHEIVISSNSCYAPEKQESLRSEFPHVRWRFNEVNLGFAGGMNAGIERAVGRAVVIMNPDVVISGGDIREAFDHLTSHAEVALVAPRIVDVNGALQDSCREFMTPASLVMRILRRLFQKRDVLLSSQRDYTQVQAVDWVIGAFMMVKREALEKVGALDADYFMYVEDMDWCKRFWDAGYEVVYYPRLQVTYKGDRKSTSALIARTLGNRHAVYHLRSYLRFLRKNRFRVSRHGKSTSA